jgi:hypothetical protein
MTDTHLCSKHSVELLKLAPSDGDATFGIRGFKTMFNRDHLTEVGGIFDKPRSMWIFTDYGVAHAAWTHVIQRCEEAQEKKAHKALPAFQSKKTKTSVVLDEAPPNRVRENDSGEPPAKKARKLTPKQRAAAAAAAEALVAEAIAVEAETSADNGHDTENEPIGQSHTLSGAAASAAASATSAAIAAPRKKFQKTKLLLNKREAWETECSIADAKPLNPNEYPCESPPASDQARTVPPPPHKPKKRIYVHEPEEPVESPPPPSEPRVITHAQSPFTMSHITPVQCEFLYGIGAECVVNVTHSIGWQPPAAHQTEHHMESETFPLVCIVTEREVENGVLCMTVRPKATRTFIKSIIMYGEVFDVLSPRDRFVFRSQKLSAVREKNMKNCIFTHAYSSTWHELFRDPCRTIAYTLKL